MFLPGRMGNAEQQVRHLNDPVIWSWCTFPTKIYRKHIISFLYLNF